MSSTAERLAAALADRYRIERELGAGGMATVYLAHDLKHEREVAIKVLHPDLGAAIGGERFLAEIKTTAKLQHPHILPLLDSGGADGLLFYVMPLVEGETLRARLTRERQLPIDAAVRIATEVAGALDYAHRHGVIHRDIKPENILLHDGRAVVADFGIALAVTAASGSRMTQTGLSLGTPQYMSPEQAMGEKVIDARSDVYALGAVLYEMLTGEPPFSGATVQAIVAKVLAEKPMHPTAVRDTIPRHVESTLLKSLAKLPADRFADAAKFAEALENPAATAGYSATPFADGSRGAAAEGSQRAVSRWRTLAAAGWLVGLGALGVAGWLWQNAASKDSPPPAVRAAVATERLTAASPLQGAGLAISPDGSKLLFLAIDSGAMVPSLFVQDFSTGAQQGIPQTAFGNQPVFSPDAREIVFHSRGAVLVTSVSGGGLRELVRGSPIAGLAWGRDSIITVASRGLLRIPAAGGRVDTLVAHPADGSRYYLAPALSPDGAFILSALAPPGSSIGDLVAVSVRERTVTELGLRGSRPVLVGRTLTFGTSDGTLWAVEMDLKRYKPIGAPRPVVQGVSQHPGGGLRMAMSPHTGTLVYHTGSGMSDREIAILDRNGRARVVSPMARSYRAPRFAPDGGRIAVGVSGATFASGDIWILSLATGVFQRVTSDTVNFHPNWEPDGKGVMFVVRRSGARQQVQSVSLDAGGVQRLITTHPLNIYEAVPTPDGKRVVFRVDSPDNARDVYVVNRDSGAVPEPIAVSRFDEKGIAVSPDGNWLAYVSDETGENEVYIRRLNASGQRWPVSRRGGVEPRWSRSGEVFFRNGDSVFASRVTLGAEPIVSAPTGLLSARFDVSVFEPLWDVSPDGRQFAVTRPIREAQQRLMVIVNALNPRP